jgi:hypothetical protein
MAALRAVTTRVPGQPAMKFTSSRLWHLVQEALDVGRHGRTAGTIPSEIARGLSGRVRLLDFHPSP